MSRLTNTPEFASKLLYSSKKPAFTLYGFRGSTNTDRVRLTLAEGGFTDYELVLLNLQKGEQKVGDPFFLADLSLPARSILVGANTVAPSPKNIRNVTRGVKYLS